MGYIPHMTEPVVQPPAQPSEADTRVHHSGFAKPEAEHLAAHLLSRLPCKAGGGEWSMSGVHRLRREAFSAESLGAVRERERH